MSKDRTLLTWPSSMMGGPILSDTDAALRYAEIAFHSTQHCEGLKLQRHNLKKAYDNIQEDEDEYHQKKANVAFAAQFTNEAIHEIIQIRMRAAGRRVRNNPIGQICPFCQETFEKHTEFGYCQDV